MLVADQNWAVRSLIMGGRSSPDPKHSAATTVNQWIDAEILPQRKRPWQMFRFAQSLLAQEHEDEVVSASLEPRPEKSEVPDVMSVSIRNVVAKGSHEGRHRVTRSTKSLLFVSRVEKVATASALSTSR
jgi:hypothetical protein